MKGTRLLAFGLLLGFACGRAPSTQKVNACSLSAQASQQITGALMLADSLAKAGAISASDSTTNVALLGLPICADYFWRYKCHYRLCLNALKDDRLEEVIQDFERWTNEASASQDSIRGYYNSLLGYLYFVKDDFESARPPLEQAADLLEKSGRTQKLQSVYNNLAPCLIRLGDYEAAEHYLKAAIRLNTANNDTKRLAGNYNNLGRNFNAYNHSQEAIGCFLRYASLQGEKDAVFFEGMTKAYFNLGDYRNAKIYALQLQESAKTAIEHEPMAFQWLGLISQAEQQHKKAITCYQQALTQWRIAEDTAHYDFGKTKIFLGNAYRSIALPYQALRYYQDALNGFIPEFKNPDIRQNPTPEQLPNEIWVMEALLNKADAWEQSFDQKAGKDSTLLIQALDAAEMATAAFIKMKSLYEEDASKLNLDKYGFIRFYEKAVQLAIRLAGVTKNKAYLHRAFYLSQHSKAGILRNALQERAVRYAANLPADSIQKIRFLEGQIAVADKRLALEKDSLALVKLDAQRFQLKRQWSKIQHWAKSILPPTASPPNLLIDEIQQRLPAETLLLEYFVGGEQLYTFGITKAGFEVFHAPITTNFETASAALVRSVSDQTWMADSSTYAEAAYLHNASYLYECLLSKPLAKFKTVRRLLIVPDGVIGRLPFSALLTQPYQGSWRDVNLPIVLQQYAVGYLYSSALLQRSDQVKVTKYGFGGFGTDYRDPWTIPAIDQGAGSETMSAWAARGGAAPLDYADDEVDSLSQLTNGHKWLNTNATKSNFLKNSSACGVLHFALHTVESPPGDASGYYLLFSKANLHDDNFLSSNELAALHLNAELAVLSACYSGLGSFQQGEGMMNLGRAFALSGCPASVVNLWQANDVVSKKIMIDFYKGLVARLPKDIALQKAQIEYLRQTSAEGATPFFWANFVVMGDVSPLDFPAKEPWWNALAFWK